MVLWNYYFAFLSSRWCLCGGLFGEVKLKCKDNWNSHALNESKIVRVYKVHMHYSLYS